MIKRFLNYLKAKNKVSQLIIVLVILPGIPFIAATVVAFTYMFWPASIKSFPVIDIPLNSKNITLIAHGLRDTPASWAQPLSTKINQLYLQQKAIAVDWADYAENTSRCATNGRRFGHKIAEQLLLLTNLRQLNLIAHSCGSFVIYGICETLRKKNHKAKIYSTFLDPVSVYGGFFWHFGEDKFGSCADYAEAYIDTEDSVPGSNAALLNAQTFDITNIRKRQALTTQPHLWPTQFYLENTQQLFKVNGDFNLLKRQFSGTLLPYPQ